VIAIGDPSAQDPHPQLSWQLSNGIRLGQLRDVVVSLGVHRHDRTSASLYDLNARLVALTLRGGSE
jgi:hypothetical protein